MEILGVLDACARSYTFPMLDNGYVYLAATRLSLYRSSTDCAMVIEVFGFSPRAGLPDLHVHTFASRLRDRDPPEKYVSRQAYENYLSSNPHNDSRFSFPIAEGAWQDRQTAELIAADAREVVVRGSPLSLPPRELYAEHGIQLEDDRHIHTYELCRFLADVARDRVLASPEEQRVSVLADMTKVLQLEEWNHPDLVNEALPSATECFVQLARVLETGDVEQYRPTQPPNTHWRNWPDGGRL